MNVSLATAKNCMRLIADGAASDAFEAMGISNEDFRLACSDECYIAADRGRVCAVLEALTYGVLDVVGLPRIEVPGEFRASIIAVFVHPSNMAVACRWMESGESAESLAVGGQAEPVTARALFALVCQLAGDGPSAQAQWRKRVGRAVELVTEMEAAE